MHLVDTSMFFAPQSGGVKRYLLTKHAWLARIGIRHTLLVPGDRKSAHENGIITIASPAIPFGNGYRFPIRMARWRDVLTGLAPDAIEAGDPYQLAWAALAAGKRLRVPVTAFFHSDLARLVGYRFGAWAESRGNRYVSSLYGRFDLVFAPSRIMYDKLRAAGVKRVVLQPLGVDIATFHPTRRDPSLRAELRLPSSERLLVFAGRFSKEKNLDLLVSAFARLGPHYHLLLVGGGPRPRLSRNITFYPYQASAGDLARLLASSDALVHAGDQETFGLVALEAMACGRPVIGVRSGAIAELVDEGVGILAAPGDATEFANAIHALYERDIDALGLEARRRVEATFSWNAVLQQQLKHYERLCGRAAAWNVPARALN